MPRKLTFIILTLLFPGYLYAFTLDTQGTQAGSVSGNFANQRYNSKDKFHDNVKAPMTDPNTPVTTLDGKQQGSAAPICGGDINNAKQVIQVTYTVGYPTTDNNGVQSYTASITVQTATATPGVLDSTVSAALDKVCQAGYMYQGTYYQWEVFQNGTINISPHVAPVGCVFPESTPLTYVGGQLSKRYADITGRPIVSSDTTATTITYYTGDVQDCTGKKKDLSQTRYYDNPYQMQSDAQTYGLTCTDPNDPTCSSYAGVQSSVITRTQTGVPQIVTCNITRTIGKNTAPENAIICTASRLYYAPGYSDTNKWCQPQTRWDYTSQLIIRCDPNGRSMTAEGWASWEGAPCGTQADFPPDNQIIYNLPYATFTDTVIGQFSVNKRNGGSNTAYNDRGDTSCYSDTNPLKVHATSTCAADMSSCQYVFTVDNAPNCSPFTITVTPPIAEHINDPCQIYEQNYTCKIQNETWYDAGNNTTAVIAIGAPTHNTVQTTCQTFPVGIVCHDWWQKKKTVFVPGSLEYPKPEY